MLLRELGQSFNIYRFVKLHNTYMKVNCVLHKFKDNGLLRSRDFNQIVAPSFCRSNCVIDEGAFAELIADWTKKLSSGIHGTEDAVSASLQQDRAEYIKILKYFIIDYKLTWKLLLQF